MNRREFAKSIGLMVSAPLMRSTTDPSTSPDSRETFDVKKFGAVGNGISDDTAAFEQALVHAARARGTVIVPPGIFPVVRTLRLSNGVTLKGSGPQSIIDRRAGDPLIVLGADIQKASVLNLRFQGSFAFALLFENSNQITIANCRISGGRLPWLTSAFCGGIFILNSDNVSIENNDLSGNGRIAEGILSSDIQINGFGDRVYSRAIRIIRNRCTSTETQTSIAAYDVQGSTISDNECAGPKTGSKNNNGYGILIYQRPGSPGSCKNNTVFRNYVHSTGGTGIYLQKSDQSRVVANTLTDVAASQDDQTLPVAGIALNQSQHVSIDGNRVTRAGHAGISIASNKAGVGYVTVAGNVITDVTGMGIHLRGQLTEIAITGNTVRRTRGGIGAYTDDPQDSITVSGNKVSETTRSSPGIILANAARSVVSNNTVEDSGGYGLAVTLRDTTSKVFGNIVVRSGRAFGGKYPNVRIVRK